LWVQGSPARSQARRHIRTIRAELDGLLETLLFLNPQLYDQVLRIAGEQAVWRAALQRAD
jgi:hypothetical protein